MKSKKFMKLYIRGAALALFVILLFGTALRAAAQRYESPPEFRGYEILEGEMVMGMNYRVDERVMNEGL